MQGTYGMEILIPFDTDTRAENSVIVHWHGRRRGLVYKDSAGAKLELSVLYNPLTSIKDTTSLNIAKAARAASWKFNERVYPPVTVSTVANKLILVVRYNNRRYNDKSVRYATLIKEHIPLMQQENVWIQTLRKCTWQ